MASQVREDDMPLVERLKILQQRRREELILSESVVQPPTSSQPLDVKPKMPLKVRKALPVKKLTPKTIDAIKKVPKIKRDPGKIEELEIKEKKRKIISKKEDKKDKNNEEGNGIDGDGDGDDDEFKWWTEKNSMVLEDDSIKWTTLTHQGLYFPPDYVPHRIHLIYGGEKIILE